MVPGYDERQARTEIQGLTKPDPNDHSTQLLAWAVCWPWNVVWTICVYNPFRYIGEFFLREIRSALFEISNGQFSAIERDLSLDPPPPPFPVRTGSSSNLPDPAATPSASVEAASVRAATDPATTENTDARHPQVVVEVADPTPQPATNATASSQRQHTNAADDDIAAEADTWAPPESTAFVPMADRPLKALKYDNGIPPPGQIAPGSRASAPPADPWFEKQMPGR